MRGNGMCHRLDPIFRFPPRFQKRPSSRRGLSSVVATLGLSLKASPIVEQRGRFQHCPICTLRAPNALDQPENPQDVIEVVNTIHIPI
jgi:hypothetical protein